MKSLLILLIFLSTHSIAQVRLTYKGDTLKGKIKRMVEYTYLWDGHLRLYTIYTSNIIERTETATFYTPHDTSAQGTWIVAFDSIGNAIKTSLYSNNDSLCVIIRRTYDHDNREIEKEVTEHSNDLYHKLYQ